MKKRALRIIGRSPLTFGEGNIKGRIKNVLNFKRPAAWVLIISVLAVILLSVFLLTNPYIGVYKYKSGRETNVAIHKIYNDRLSAATRSLEQLTLDEGLQ